MSNDGAARVLSIELAQRRGIGAIFGSNTHSEARRLIATRHKRSAFVSATLHLLMLTKQSSSMLRFPHIFDNDRATDCDCRNIRIFIWYIDSS